MNRINIAVLGLGTVGQGVVMLLDKQKEEIRKATGCEICLKRCLEKFKTKKLDVALAPGVLTDRWSEVVEDPEIQIIIETIGGIEPARTYILQALKAGKNVVTANKDLLAACGQELFKAAAENHRDLYYEAGVGGAIPLVGPLRQSLAASHLTEVIGIVNGTTNYILTRMEREGRPFDDILRDAMSLGYSEADPSADIEGYDAARKMAILATLAFHSQVTIADVYVEGISRVDLEDIRSARRLGYAVKLLGIARLDGELIEVRVHPALIPLAHPLASVHDNLNAILVNGEDLGDSMFYGVGAGRLPSASAILGDVAAIARNIKSGCEGRLNLLDRRERAIKPMQDVETRFFLRLVLADQPGVLAKITEALANHGVSLARVLQTNLREGDAELVFVTHSVRDGDMQLALAEIGRLAATKEIVTVLRVEGLE